MTKHVAVRPHVRRAPQRVVVLASPTPFEESKPLLPAATSPMQCSDYDYPGGGRFNRSTGLREYSDTIVDRAELESSEDHEDHEHEEEY